jgi:hypothetical protein
LVGNYREIKKYTMAITRQGPINSNRGMSFSVQSMLRYYKQDKLGVAVSLITADVQLLAEARDSSGT